jgi:hypothetical protein
MFSYGIQHPPLFLFRGQRRPKETFKIQKLLDFPYYD